MEKLLLKQNREQADAHITDLNRIAEGLTNIVDEFNSMPVLSSLNTSEQVFEFLSDPLNIFEGSILMDTGIVVSENAKLNPGQVARLFNIPYSDFVNLIDSTNFQYLGYMIFDEKKKIVELDPDKIEDIKESFKKYTESPAEAKEILKIRRLCNLLNEHIKHYDLKYDLHRAAQILNISLIPNPDSKGYIFKENVLFVRERLGQEI